MKSKLALATLAAIVAVPTLVPAPALAFDHHSNYYRNNHYNRGHYHHRCGGGNGAVGTIAGGVGGALIGNAVGGGTLGTIAGGVGGGLLGRHLDKQNTRHRRGC